MLLTIDINRTPHAYGSPELSVRSLVASLYLSRKINLHVIARRNDVPPTDHWMILYNARRIEHLYSKYDSLARELKFDYLLINTRILEIAACSIATHIIKGEYEEARRMRDNALNTEAEISEAAMRERRHAANEEIIPKSTTQALAA